MKMQRSVFLVEEGGAKCSLSGLVSEWLFSSKFWSEVNAKCGTMFDQYEEDEADVSMVGAVIAALDKRIQSLRFLAVQDVEFISSWTEGCVPVRSCVSKDVVLSELLALRGFLMDATAKNSSVVFSL